MFLDPHDDDFDLPETFWTSTKAFGVRLREGQFETDYHSHSHAQLMVLDRGDATCQSEHGLWVAPATTALWIPATTSHRVKIRAPLDGYGLLVDPEAATFLPQRCGAIAMTPLLRALLVRAAELPLDAPRSGMAGRLYGLMLDELANTRIDEFPLPVPRDPRLWRLVDGLAKNPADDATLGVWAKRLGLGERTLNRLLVAETGLSFRRWRQQLHVVLAMPKLAGGASVQSVAFELGYESASSFVTMFKRTLGQTPGAYAAKFQA